MEHAGESEVQLSVGAEMEACGDQEQLQVTNLGGVKWEI